MFGSNLITDPTDRIEELSSEKGTNDSDSSIHEERKVIAETQKMKISTEQERIVESTTIESEPVFVNISFEQEDFSITKEGTLIKYIGQKEHVKIPKGVKIIGEGAFEDRKNLVSISIPQGVLRIERGAFSKCKALINVQIPSSVKIRPEKGVKTPAVVWKLSKDEEHRLDRCEGFPKHYTKDNIIVQVNGVTVSTMAYIMTDWKKDQDPRASLQPSEEYLNIIRRGYREHKFFAFENPKEAFPCHA